MTLDDSRARRLIVAAAAFGLLLRLVFALVYWVDRPLTHDEHEYLSLARGIANGTGFVYDDQVDAGTAQRFGRAPGYPLFLAALDAGRPVPAATPTRVKVAQSFIGAATVWIAGLLALAAAGPRAGVAAALGAAVYPSLVWLPGYALSEALYSLIALATALVLQRAVDRDKLLFAILAGTLTGAAALVRPAMLLYLPLVCVWLLRRRPAFALAIAVAAAVTIAPWSVRNLRVYDHFVLIASEGGVTFWTGNHPLARGEGDLAANPALKQAELAFRGAHAGLSAEALEPLYYREAFSWIAAHPGSWAALLARKVFYTIVPVGPSYAVHSARYRLASVVPYAIVLPFAVIGAWRLWRSRSRPVALYLLAASAIVVCVLFFPQERFRIPVIDPTLIVSAAALAARPRS
jgi:4-amino-4-deoxy-L-arabinose transferase-like glycosyltransferase